VSLDCLAQGSHLVPLARCLVATSGSVLELGAGEWSTPFLRRYCAAAGRELLTLENYEQWAAEFGVAVADYDVTIPAAAELRWSIVLVDHRPAERRIPDLRRFVGKAEHILLHDYHDFSREIGSIGSAFGVSWRKAEVDHDTLVLSS
jgi:hypothetical protein